MKRALLFLSVLMPFLAQATVDPCLPAKPQDQDRLLFQFTPWLSDFDADRLNTKLVNFARETSNQIAIVVVDSLCGYPASDFAAQLGEAWGLGQGKWDNGVVILVKPTGGPGQRQVFIATGYGLEEKIPDAICRRIVDNEIIPRFKEGEPFEALDAATDVLFGLAKGAFDAKSYGKSKRGSSLAGLVVPILIVLVFAVVFWFKRGEAKRYARTNNIDFWSAWWLLNQASRSHRGSWGGFSGGGGGGGSSGGGFGGFGGGSFGGGGAGGSW